MTSRTPLRLRASHGKIAVTALKMATSRNRVRNTFGTWLVQPSPVRTGGAGCPARSGGSALRPGLPPRRGSCSQFLQVGEEVQALGVGQRFGVAYFPAVDDVGDCQLRQFAGSGSG